MFLLGGSFLQASMIEDFIFGDAPDGAYFSSCCRSFCGSVFVFSMSKRPDNLPGRSTAHDSLHVIRQETTVGTEIGAELLFMESASTPKVRYFVLIRPLSSMASWSRSILEYSLRILSWLSPFRGMTILSE